eukprot:CAMPEP_0201490962 /NCGR_PEP_ID=MMETSP0151_2-20130828/28102_1 /ASSEMBLY_ACC=CAM_ASM_000257 /TAXON_ID=200890 /ORGANISM="Paramoeba atlantica, Strain 621/1 / CCAP 1560/9" /LENGTH=229 /DNA_ID=CAMNT_0047877129 /DNA_START=63 /DNA_END=752 /DNA_ORIENTATION=+
MKFFCLVFVLLALFSSVWGEECEVQQEVLEEHELNPDLEEGVCNTWQLDSNFLEARLLKLKEKIVETWVELTSPPPLKEQVEKIIEQLDRFWADDTLHENPSDIQRFQVRVFKRFMNGYLNILGSDFIHGVPAVELCAVEALTLEDKESDKLQLSEFIPKIATEIIRQAHEDCNCEKYTRDRISFLYSKFDEVRAKALKSGRTFGLEKFLEESEGEKKEEKSEEVKEEL